MNFSNGFLKLSEIDFTLTKYLIKKGVDLFNSLLNIDGSIITKTASTITMKKEIYF
jgi:hypothetical protein